MPLEFVHRSEVRSMRSAIAHGNSESLCAADGRIRAEFAGRHKKRQAQQVCSDNDLSSCRMNLLYKRAVVVQRAIAGRILYDRADEILWKSRCFMISDDDLDAQGICPGPDDADGLRVAGLRDKECCPGGVSFDRSRTCSSPRLRPSLRPAEMRLSRETR